jgi:hypothetical protein
MDESGKDPLPKGAPSARSLRELMDLLLKLNSKIREKISPRPPRPEKASGNTEMVIIILSHSEEPPPKPSRGEKPKASPHGWIDDLCKDIEGRKGPRKAS